MCCYILTKWRRCRYLYYTLPESGTCVQISKHDEQNTSKYTRLIFQFSMPWMPCSIHSGLTIANLRWTLQRREDFFWADLEGKKRSESSALEMGPWDCGTRQWDQLPCHGPDSIGVWSQHISQLRFDSWLVSEHTARGFHGDQSLGTSTSGVHQLGGMHFSGSGRRISLFKIRKIKKRTDRSITR